MSDRPTTREELLEAALRVALRKLGGRLYSIDRDAHARRPAEGDVIVRFSRDGRIEAELSGYLTTNESLAILVAMDEGADPIVAADDWLDVYAGNVRYRSAAGHEVVVFNDCDGWDYIDSIVHVDGRRWEFDDDCNDSSPRVSDWSPDHGERWGLTDALRGKRALIDRIPRIKEPHHG